MLLMLPLPLPPLLLLLLMLPPPLLRQVSPYQSPKLYSGIVAAFHKLCNKNLRLQERHGLWHQELYNWGCVRPGDGWGYSCGNCEVLHPPRLSPCRVPCNCPRRWPQNLRRGTCHGRGRCL